jgi:hypothetical protein
LQVGPGCAEFVDVQLRPSLNEALLGLGQGSGDALNRVDRERRFRILVDRVEMWPMVRRARLRKHANDDAEKATELGHVLP